MFGDPKSDGSTKKNHEQILFRGQLEFMTLGSVADIQNDCLISSKAFKELLMFRGQLYSSHRRQLIHNREDELSHAGNRFFFIFISCLDLTPSKKPVC